MTPFRFIILFVIYFCTIISAFNGEYFLTAFWLACLFVFFEIEGINRINPISFFCYVLLLFCSVLWYIAGHLILANLFCGLFILASLWVQFCKDSKIG